MNQKQIEIKVSPDGSKVEMDALNFTGTMCEETIKRILDGVGTMEQSKKKDEYYRTGSEGVSVNT